MIIGLALALASALATNVAFLFKHRILVFCEPIETGAVAITGRLIAFCLVIAGAALMPAPLRAARHPHDEEEAAAADITYAGRHALGLRPPRQ